MKNLTLCMLLFLAPVFSARAELILPVDSTTAGFVGMAVQGPLDEPIIVTSFPEFTAIFGSSTAGLANPYLAPSVAGYFANGGVRLAVVRVSAVDFANVIGVDGGAPGSRTGLQALLDVDEVSFIAIPGVATPAVQTAMINHCQSAGDRMAILDPAVPDDFDAIQVQRAGLVTENGFGALYFPWIQAEPTEVSLLLPPSGFVAGYYSASHPPDSPVGVIATATAVAYHMTNPEQDLLNAQNINPIRNLSGIRIWGARTLADSNDWKYVAVRRLGFFIEESITEGTEWCLTVPNDFFLWTTLEQDMDIFLFGLYAQGWLQGATPNDAFFAQCGLGATMTQIDIDQGRTIMSVGFAPVAPAEFVILNIVHQRPDVSSARTTRTAAVTLLPPAPNPFNPTTTLRFEVAHDTSVDLDIFDAAGRLVRTLLAGQPFAAGDHSLRWNGRDDGGGIVGSGVYLAQYRSEGLAKTQRLVLVR